MKWKEVIDLANINKIQHLKQQVTEQNTQVTGNQIPAMDPTKILLKNQKLSLTSGRKIKMKINI